MCCQHQSSLSIATWYWPGMTSAKVNSALFALAGVAVMICLSSERCADVSESRSALHFSRHWMRPLTRSRSCWKLTLLSGRSVTLTACSAGCSSKPACSSCALTSARNTYSPGIKSAQNEPSPFTVNSVTSSCAGVLLMTFTLRLLRSELTRSGKRSMRMEPHVVYLKATMSGSLGVFGVTLT